MTDSIASWITLSALIGSAGWYMTQTPDRQISSLVMSFMSGVLCLFGGFLISGAVMKVTGSFENAIIPALLVCVGTAVCTIAHTVYTKKKATQKSTK